MKINVKSLVECLTFTEFSVTCDLRFVLAALLSDRMVKTMEDGR